MERQRRPYLQYTPFRLASCMSRTGILEQSMGSRNRVGTGLSYRPARLYRLAGSIPRNRFLGSIKILKYRYTNYMNYVRFDLLQSRGKDRWIPATGFSVLLLPEISRIKGIRSPDGYGFCLHVWTLDKFRPK
jgi:hypothetical protein